MATIAPTRILEPGTSGWTASDLEDPEISRQWEAGRFEIVNGVLKTMPPAYFDHGAVTFELLSLAREHCRKMGQSVLVSVEADLIIGEDDVLRVDGMLMTRDDVQGQRKLIVQLGKDPSQVQRIRVAPLLVIESVSPGHERHDTVTKRRLYAGFGIPNYWIVNRLRKSLECLVLDGDDYRTDAAGRGNQVIEVPAFQGIRLPLQQVWDAAMGDPDESAG